MNEIITEKVFNERCIRKSRRITVLCLAMTAFFSWAYHQQAKKNQADEAEMNISYEKQPFSESEKGSYAMVTRSVEIHQNGQITHEVELDKDGDGKPDFQAKFNGPAFLSKGEKVALVSLIKHPSFKHFSALAHQKERF